MRELEDSQIRQNCHVQYAKLISSTNNFKNITTDSLVQYNDIYNLRSTIPEDRMTPNDLTDLANTTADLSDKHYHLATRCVQDKDQIKSQLEKSIAFAKHTISWCAMAPRKTLY